MCATTTLNCYVQGFLVYYSSLHTQKNRGWFHAEIGTDILVFGGFLHAANLSSYAQAHHRYTEFDLLDTREHETT